jgi:hypothetical protein
MPLSCVKFSILFYRSPGPAPRCSGRPAAELPNIDSCSREFSALGHLFERASATVTLIRPTASRRREHCPGMAWRHDVTRRTPPTNDRGEAGLPRSFGHMPPPYRPRLASLLRSPQPGALNSQPSTPAALAGARPSSGEMAAAVPTAEAPYRPAPQERRLRSTDFGQQTDRGGPPCIRGEVAVGAVTPQHEPPSLCLANPGSLPSPAASLLQIGSSHEGSHE